MAGSLSLHSQLRLVQNLHQGISLSFNGYFNCLSSCLCTKTSRRHYKNFSTCRSNSTTQNDSSHILTFLYESNKICFVSNSHNLCDVSYASRRSFHTSYVTHRFLDTRDEDYEKKSKELVVHQNQYFDEAAQKAKDKKTFHEALQLYIKRNATHRRGHVEFIYAAVEHMKEFKVHRDLETYKKVLDLFPRYKMVPRNSWQVEFMHYPKQQQCCIDVLDFMEDNGVIPDDEVGYQLVKIFGPNAHAFRKYRRMMYWMPKFRFANPYYVPFELPADDLELAMLAVKRMAVDLENIVTVFRTSALENAMDQTYIVSAQSPAQCQLIQDLPRQGGIECTVFVEGGYLTWLRTKSLTYFVLRSGCTDRYRNFKKTSEESDEDMFNWSLFSDERPRELVVRPSVHEQEDGTVLAMCITGSASKDSLVSWIRFLERTNPALTEIPVVFLLRSPGTEIEKLTSEPVCV